MGFDLLLVEAMNRGRDEDCFTIFRFDTEGGRSFLAQHLVTVDGEDPMRASRHEFASIHFSCVNHVSRYYGIAGGVVRKERGQKLEF